MKKYKMGHPNSKELEKLTKDMFLYLGALEDMEHIEDYGINYTVEECNGDIERFLKQFENDAKEYGVSDEAIDIILHQYGDKKYNTRNLNFKDKRMIKYFSSDNVIKRFTSPSYNK